MDRGGTVRGLDAPAAPNNLPHQLTSFIGREAELRALKALLATARLVTLIGTGGAGKSRLAAQVANASLNLWPDGVWWVELESAKDVSGAVSSTLELPGMGSALDVVASWLATKRALVILDNCEQLVAECADFATAALQRCPHLTIIATSREPLGVPGEVRWPIASLGDPDALQLFEARGQLVSPGFKVATPNREPVSQICDRLDRLPLAIEMAAARLDMMSPRELLSNLNDRFRFLTSGTRNAPDRQQTLAATIDWSHRLLTGEEARLFRRLSIFQGGFTLEGAQAVCADGPEVDVIGLLGGLVQKSMVVADRLDDDSTRFRLLESQHAFALDRLRDADELELMGRRHYWYFMGWLASQTVASTGPASGGPAPGIAGQKRKARESANLWAALTWARAGVPDKGLSLAMQVADFEFTDHTRARTLLVDLLERSQAKGAPRAKALNLSARLAMRQADHASARALADSSVAVAREVGDPELIAHALRGAGVVYHAVGELDVAAHMYEEALSQLNGSDNERLAIEVKNQLGVLTTERGKYKEGLEILAECVAYGRSQSDEPSTARFLESLANAQFGLGEVDAAASSWMESLATFRELNDAFGTIWCIGGLSLVAAARGDDDRTLRLAAVAQRMSREWSLSAWSLRINQLDAACERAKKQLGARKSEGAWNEGEAMSTTRALEYALGEDKPPAETSPEGGPLSRRELEVVALVAGGMTNRQIADRLFIAERTAEGHVERIRNKLEVRSRTEVAMWAVEHGIVARNLDKNPPASTV
ncbi:MAG TPA: LuxR C-terminal-related transcriptional regulator [Candidatus Dormibacteraeota bacterium]|nr:LuxR C-terminal-related transcriptional regulator [Candidatus Dormibacteraeota bacterium]